MVVARCARPSKRGSCSALGCCGELYICRTLLVESAITTVPKRGGQQAGQRNRPGVTVKYITAEACHDVAQPNTCHITIAAQVVDVPEHTLSTSILRPLV
jgi:hypothetical protein